MKKIFAVLCTLLCISISATAGSTKQCSISGGGENATVVASVIEVHDGYVIVAISNDGNFGVNVIVNVSIHNYTGSRSVYVKPQMEQQEKIHIGGAKEGDSPSDCSITTLSGKRCN